ncbi:MAG TPA: kynureninase [Anaerolineales bacterium]|nr:kynureninase [Anaerolineales bacterium]
MDITQARTLDSTDPLAHFRDRFEIPDPGLIYLDGNSLGRMPKAVRPLMDELLAKWSDRLIRGWNEGWWLDLQTRIGDKIARLVGAAAGEVIIADSTSINLYKLAAAALEMRPGRAKIVTDDLNFPSDIYILESVCRASGAELIIVPSDGLNDPLDGLADAVDDRTALLSLSHTVFKSGWTYPLGRVTEMAHRAGALTLWDLSHSAGAVPVGLAEAGADLAVGCTYKYLNGGPGAPAFLYVRKDLQEEIRNPIAGWIGQDRPFEFGLEYQPAPGLRRTLTGTPTILSIAAIEPGVDLLLEAGLDALRTKSLAQTDFLIENWESELAARGYGLKSPRDHAVRGSHISLSHPEAWGIDQALIEELGVIPDFRAPDNLRLGVAPIYTSFEEIYRAVEGMARIVDEKMYETYKRASVEVT